jgi:hypothetical protein
MVVSPLPKGFPFERIGEQRFEAFVPLKKAVENKGTITN